MSGPMRRPLLLLALAIPFPTGCSAYIAGAGTDLSTLATREQVEEQFGRPDEAAVIGGWGYEVYRTRRKIADKERADSLEMMSAMTSRTAELATFPIELATLVTRSIGGRTVRFCYAPAGRVIAVYLDGSELHFHGNYPSALESTDQQNKR